MGLYACLSLGHLQTCPDDFGLVVDLIAQEKAAAWIEKRNVNPNTSLAQFRRGLVYRLGLFITRGWSQLIIDRWHGAVTNRPSQPASAGVGLKSGVDFKQPPRRRLLRHARAWRLSGVGHPPLDPRRRFLLCNQV